MKALAVLAFVLASTLVDASSSLCAGLPPGEIVLLPFPGDCSRFYECYDGAARILECPNGEWFNEAIQACDRPEYSGCSTFVCPPGIVDYYPFPGDCSQFIECYLGFPEHLACPSGLWFSPYERRCVAPVNSGCGMYSTSPDPTWTTPGTCYGVLPGQIVLKPYPGDCTRFIECLGSAEHDLVCPLGLWFDERRQMCNFPALTGCSGGPYPTPPAGYDDPRCVDGNNDYWPDVDCTKFIECWEGHGHEFDCPSGLYFDSRTIECVNPSESDCGRTVGPTTLPPTSPGWTPDPICPWPSYDRFLFPYPGDCTKYIVCYFGTREVESCPPDLWFNPILEVCDYPYEAGCIPW